MGHLIEFRAGFIADVEVSPGRRLERVRIGRGLRIRARVVPHVVETMFGPVEAANLHFDDGTVLRTVRYEQFRFVD
jgi:hypothetical protein